jgi:hypothetical protein
MSTEKIKSKNGEEHPLQKLYNYYSSPIDLQKDERTSGLIGWVLVAGLVIAYDAYAMKTKKAETLTRSFWRLSEGKMSKAPVFGAWAILTSHLLLEKKVRRKIFKQN